MAVRVNVNGAFFPWAIQRARGDVGEFATRYPQTSRLNLRRTQADIEAARKLRGGDARERFKLSASSSATISQIITATIDAGMIKADPDAPPGRRFSRYLPVWA